MEYKLHQILCTKHIEIDCRVIREQINTGIIKTGYVKSAEQLANIFTKAFGKAQHCYLQAKIGMLDIFQGFQLEGKC